MANIPTFGEQGPGWSAPGVEPSEEFKAEGYKAGYKPPAGFFNWFWTKVSRNVAELQKAVTSYGAANEEDKAAMLDGSAAVGRAVRMETERSILTDLSSEWAASFDGTADITPGVTGTLPVAKGGTGRNDGRATGIGGVLPVSFELMWSGSAAAGNNLTVNLDGYRLFAISTSGNNLFGFKLGTNIYAFSNQLGTDNIRAAVAQLQYVSATQWRYLSGGAVSNLFSGAHSANLGAPAIDTIYGVTVTGGVI